MRKIIPLLSVCGLIMFAFAFASHNTQAQDQLSGIIDHFTDGDSFIMRGQKVRLWGIDAPEYYQNCLDALGKEYPCGKHTRQFFEDLARGRSVLCDIMPAAKRESRIVAKCSLGEADLGSQMVSSGHAIDYTYFSDGFYNSEERAAKSGQKGIWQGAFTEPYQWRKQNKR